MPKDQVLQFIDSLSPLQWRTCLSYIILPASRLPDVIRIDLTAAFLNEGRCAVIACFEEALEEVRNYVGRLCDLKSKFETIPSSEATLAKLRGTIERQIVLVIKDLDSISGAFLQEYLSLNRYRTSGSLGVTNDYGVIAYGPILRRTRYGNPEAATYNKLGRAIFKTLQDQRRAFGFHIVTPEMLAKQSKPVLEPESPYSDSYLVTSFFSRYRESFIVDTGIKSIWR